MKIKTYGTTIKASTGQPVAHEEALQVMAESVAQGKKLIFGCNMQSEIGSVHIIAGQAFEVARESTAAEYVAEGCGALSTQWSHFYEMEVLD